MHLGNRYRVGIAATSLVAVAATFAVGAVDVGAADVGAADVGPGSPCLDPQQMAEVQPGWTRARVIRLVEAQTPQLDRGVVGRTGKDDHTYRVQVVEGAGTCGTAAGAILVAYERAVVNGETRPFRVKKVRIVGL